MGFSKQLWPHSAGTEASGEASGKAKSIQESMFSSLPDPMMVPAHPQRMAALQAPAVPHTNSSATGNTQDLRAAGRLEIKLLYSQSLARMINFES